MKGGADLTDKLREASRLWDGLHADFPGSPVYALQAVVARRMAGAHLVTAGRPAEAEPLLRGAVETYDGLPAARQDDPGLRAELARALYYLADARYDCGRQGEAEAAWLREADILQKLSDEDPKSGDHHFELAYARRRLSDASGLRSRVLAGLPALGLGVLPYPLGMGIGIYSGQQQAAFDAYKEAAARNREAVARLRRALECDPANRGAAGMLYPWADDLSRTAFVLRDHALLAEAVDALADAAGRAAAAGAPDAGTLFRHAAWAEAYCLPLARADKSLADSGRQAEVIRAFADRTVGLLRQAVAAGYRDAKELREAKELQDPAVREGVQAVLAELEKLGKP
jgi:hypothetical protein